MSELLKYLEQVGSSVSGSSESSRPVFEPPQAQLAPRQERQESPEESARRIQGNIESVGPLVHERSNWEAVKDVASGVASGVYGTATGGMNLLLNPDEINRYRAPQEWLESLQSPQARAQAEAYNRETEAFNRTIETAVMEGRISSTDGQIEIAKNSFKNLNAATIERAVTEGAGSVGFLIGMSAFGPPGAIAGWTAMGASTLAAPVDGVLTELYAEVAPGEYKYTHEDLIDSSPVYQEAFEKTGDEEEARRAVFNEARKKAVLTPENIGGTLLELAGERLLLKMSGALKTSREIGGITSVPRNVTTAFAGETAAEVSGDTLSTIAANVGIQETFDETRDRYAGVGEGVPQAVIGAAGGVGVTTPGTVLTGAANTLSGRSSRGGNDIPSQTDNLVNDINAAVTPREGQETEGEPAENDIVSRLRNVQELYNTGAGKEIPENLREIAGTENNRIRQIVALYEHVESGNATPEETIEIGRVLQDYSNDLDAATNALGDPNQIEDADQARIIQAAVRNRDQILNNNKDMESAVQKATELVASREVQRDDSGALTPEGTKTVSDKLALAPETLTEQDVDAALDMMPNFSEPEREKLRFIRESLNKQRELDQQRADAGMGQPIDVVGREVLSEYGEGSKGRSVLGHATSIMDSMRNGRAEDAKTQMGNLRRFIQSHSNKLNALEKAVKNGSNKATYRTFNKAQGRGVNRTMEVKGTAPNLRRAVAQELAFMEDVYNRLASTYSGIGNPVSPNPLTNTLFSGSEPEADTRTPQQRVTEPQTQRAEPRMTPENAQQLSSANLYRRIQSLESGNAQTSDPESELSVLRDEAARREQAVEESVQPIEQVESMTRPQQREYLGNLRSIPEHVRSEDLANHISQVAEIMNRPEPAPETNVEAEPEVAEPIERVKAKFAQLDLESSERLLSSLGSGFISKLYDGSISQGELALLEQRIDAYLSRPTPPTPPTRPTEDTTPPAETTPAPTAPEAAPQANTVAQSQATTGLEGNAPRRSSTSFLAPIEAAVDSLKKISPLVDELDSVEQSFEKTTNEFTLYDLGDKADRLYGTISQNVDEIVNQLIDQLDNLPSQVADGIRDELLDLRDSDGLATDSFRALSDILREARNIANSTGDIFGNSTPQQSEGTAQPSNSDNNAEAKSIFGKTKIAQAMNIAADRTRIYADRFMTNLVNTLRGAEDSPTRTYGNYLVQQRNRISQMMGTYDEVGAPTPGSMLERIHTAMDNQLIYNLDSSPSKVKILEDLLKPYIGKQSIQDWMSKNLPKPPNTRQGREQGRQQATEAIRSVLAQNMDEAAVDQAMNQFKADILARNRTHRMLDLMDYDPETNQFTLNNRVMNAASLALSDYVANFRQYAETYQEPAEVAKALGATDSQSLTTNYQGERGILTTEQLSILGYSTFRRAVDNVSTIANDLLGMRGKKSAGEGNIRSPMQNLIGTLMENLSEDPNIPVSFVSIPVTNDNGVTFPLLVPTQTPEEGTVLVDLSLAGDLGTRSTLVEPDRIRYVNTVPRTRTTDKQGNRLTKKQQDAMAVANNIEFRANPRTFNLLARVLGRDGVIQAFGNPEALDETIPMSRLDRESQNGKNIQVLNALQELLSLENEIVAQGGNLTETPVRYSHAYSSVTRLMMEGGYNPQADKLIRAVMSPHATEVDASTFVEHLESGSMADASNTNKFLTLAYAQALGVSIQNRTMDQIKDDLNEIFDAEMRGIAQEWSIAATEPTTADLTGLIDRTKAKLGGDFSELAVQTLAEFGDILNGNDVSAFTTHAYIEADGITNGPFMAGMTLGIQQFSPEWVRFVTNGGMYIGREETSNDYRSSQIADPEADRPDNYTAVTQEANTLVASSMLSIFHAGNNRVKDAIRSVRQVFMNGMSSPVINGNGEIEISRNVGKNPVTVTFYGSGPTGIASKFAGEIAQGIYEVATAALQSNSIEEFAEAVIKGDISTEQKVTALQNLLKSYDYLVNGRIGFKEGAPFYSDRSGSRLNILGRFMNDKESLVNLRLTNEQMSNLAANLRPTLVQPLIESLEGLAGSTLESTETIQRGTSAFSDLLASVFQKEIQQLISNPEFDPTVGLTRRDIEGVINKLKAFGITDNIGDSLFSLVTQEGAIPGLSIPLDTLGGTGLHHMESSYKNLSNIGVGGIPRFVISRGDGATIVEFFNKAVEAGVTTPLAVFDGINLGVNEFETGSKLANESVLHSIMQNPVQGLMNQIEKGMIPMLEELGFTIGPDSSVSIANGRQIKELADTLTERVGSRDIAESIVLRALKNANIIPGAAQNDSLTLEDFNNIQLDSPIILVPRVARSIQDLQKLIKTDAELEAWKAIHPFMRTFEDVNHLHEVKRKYDNLYLEHPEGLGSIFSTASLKLLANRVTENLDTLKRFNFSVDQMAGVGQPATNDGITLDSKDPSDIAEALEAESQRAREDKFADEKHHMFRMNMKHWERGEDGEMILKDFKGFRELLSTSFPKGDFRNNIADRVVRLAERLGVEVVIDTKAPGAKYSPSINSVVLNNNSSVSALHELVHSVITKSLHDKFVGGKKLHPAAEKAISDLESIMNELINDPNAVLSPTWSRAITHIKRAGNVARASQGPQAATGAMINEMLAIWLTNPTLAADAMSRPPRSKLRQLGEAALELFRSIFRLKKDDKVDSLFMHMAYNMNSLAVNALKTAEVTEGSSPSLDMFDPDTFNVSQPMYREFMESVNQAEARLRETDKDLTLRRDLDSVESADIFTSNGFHMDPAQQQAFEQIREAFTVSSRLNPEVKSSLYRLAAHVFRNLKPEHFGDTSQPGTPSYHVAHNKHAAVTGSASGSREAMVVNLIALATVNPEMKEVLNQIGLPEAERTSETESTWEKTLGQAGYDAMNKLSNYLSGARKDEVPADLLGRLLDTLEKKPEGESVKVWALPGQIVDKVNEKVSDLLTDLGNYTGDAGQKILRNSNSKAATISGGIIGAVGAALSKDSAMGFAEEMNTVLNNVNNMNFLKDSMRDIIGRTDLNSSVYDLIKVVRSHVQRLRQMYVEGVENNIKNKFKTQPSQEQMNSLQRTLAETDIAAVVGARGLDSALDTLSSDAKVDRRIKQLENIINKEFDSAFLLDKAAQLAHYMNTGETGSMLLLNASHIAGRFGQEGSMTLQAVDASLAHTIDEYVSLLAFQGTDTETFRQMMKDEPEAIRYIMAVQDGIRRDELAKSGTYGKPVGIKGYIPNKSAGSIRIIRDDMAQDYINKGYTRVGDYTPTAYDNPNIRRGYYVNMLDENRPFAQGIIQNVVASHNGLTVNDDPLTENLIPTGFDIETMESIIEQGIRDYGDFGLVPIFDEQGNVVNLVRAIDPKVVREKNTNNDFAANLGSWRGRQIEENTAENINKVIVEELDRAYERDTKKGEYVDLLDMDTEDPVIKDALSVLNREAIRYSRDTFGRMMVRKELLNNVIGYRQAGVADIWNGISRFKPETRRHIQRALEAMIGPKAFKYMVQGEDTLRGIVADAKQLIVVKSVVIPAVNGLSNILHLVARGVPVQSIARSIPRKLAEVEQYSQGMKRIIEIESEILATTEPAKISRLESERSSILEHQKTLSIYPLIESGEFASIVSVQIDQESGDLSRGRIAEYLESKINLLPPAGRTLTNNVLISKNTAIYQFLQKSVDYGDFIAKAIIYDDIVNRQKKSPQYALGRVKEEFINYDYLPGRTRGALEANGLLWFFNFKMRSLKIALSMIRENPVTALMTIGTAPMSTPFGNLGLPLDDNIVSQTYSGAAGYSVGPGMGVNAAMLHPLSAVIF